MRYNKLALSDWLYTCDWGPWGIGACQLNWGVDGGMGPGSASVLCVSTSASVQLIINKYGCVLCAS